MHRKRRVISVKKMGHSQREGTGRGEDGRRTDAGKEGSQGRREGRREQGKGSAGGREQGGREEREEGK